MFAKIYGHEDNQVLVKIDTDDESQVEVRFYFTSAGMGVCSVAISFGEDSEQSWDAAEEYFKNVDEEKARGITDGVKDDFLRDIS